MMRASSVAEATARAVVAAVGKLRREPLSKAPGIAEAVDWAEAATLAQQGRRALAGRVQALDRRRAEGRGGPRLHLRPARRHASRRRPHERRAAPAARRAAFISFVALLRANGFRGRAGADDRVSRRDRTARPARVPRTSGGPGSRRSRRRPSGAPPTTRCFDIHFLGGEEMPGAEGEDEDVVRAAGGGARRRRAAAGRRGQRIGRDGGARRGAGRAPLRLERPERSAAPAGARGPDAPAAAARASADAGAARRPGRTCAAPCAKPRATTAR